MAPFSTLAEFKALLAAAPPCDMAARERAEARNERLTKPPHSLGRLDDLAIWLAGWQGTDRPHVDRPQVAIFARDRPDWVPMPEGLTVFETMPD